MNLTPAQLNCLCGEHEEKARMTFQVGSGGLESKGFGVPTVALLVCKHCNVLYPQKNNRSRDEQWTWVNEE